MKLHRLQRIQHLDISIQHAWDFFSDPRNLPRITPPWLNFAITSDVSTRMYPGMIISYRLTPLWRFKVQWVSEITHVREPVLFVDEQRLGPYRFWHHQHLFEETAEGVRMQDIVHYVLPCGVLGRFMHRVGIHRKLKEIFAFRRSALERLF